MKGLQYEQLEDPEQAIRLLRVLTHNSGDRTDEPPQTDILTCELKPYMRGPDCPKYTALSYAWGNGTETRKIRIDGELCDINATVELALREMRRRAEIPALDDETASMDLFVWVDQICINQADEVEKGRQVSHMLHTYSEADHVIAWLGSPWPECGFLFEYFTKLGTALIEGDFDSIRDYHSDRHFRDRVARAYYDYCERLYWKRLWVIQEYAVPRRLTIACGPWTVDSAHVYAVVVEDAHPLQEGQDTTLEELADILGCFQSLFENIPSSFVMSIMTRRSGYQWATDNLTPRTELFIMLTTALVLEGDYNLPQTTDPRDRVFSLLGLISDETSCVAFPDYSMSCESVYQKTAEVLLSQEHIDVLAYCQFPKSLTGLASWVPDWSMGLRDPCCIVAYGTQFMASRTSEASRLVVDGSSLILDGVLVDTIKERSALVWDPNWLLDLDEIAAKAYVEEVTRFCQNSHRIRAEDEETDIGRIAIAESGGQHGHIPWADYYDMIRDGLRDLIGIESDDESSTEDAESADELANGDGNGEEEAGRLHKAEAFLSVDMDLLEDLSINEDQDEPPEPAQTMLARDNGWYRASLKRLHSRRPFITATGFVGLCPKAAEVGDEIFVFLGAKTPYLLRPIDDGNAYRLVGETYVHGIMYGEMMKGDPEIVQVTLI